MSRLLNDEDSSFARLVLSIVEPELNRRQLESRQSTPPTEWMTETELSKLLRCSTDTLRTYALREEDPLPYGKVGEMRRYHRADVDASPRAEGRRDRERRLGVRERPKSGGR